MRVASLHRYPVKSMLGEDVEAVVVDARGVLGDRRWSVRTAEDKIGSGKTTRHCAALPGLQQLRARTSVEQVLVRFPDGATVSTRSPDLAERLTRHVGQAVTLAEESVVSHFDDGPLSVLSRGSVEALAEDVEEFVDPARFRANVLIEGLPAFGEEQWVGRRVRIGAAVLLVELASPRCRMVDSATADLPPLPGLLRATGRVNAARLGVVASVVEPGRIAVGDAVSVL